MFFLAKLKLTIIYLYYIVFLSPTVPRKIQKKAEYEYTETPQEKKLRLAKLYLEQLKEAGTFIVHSPWCSNIKYPIYIYLCVYVFISCFISWQTTRELMMRTLGMRWLQENLKKKWWVLSFLYTYICDRGVGWVLMWSHMDPTLLYGTHSRNMDWTKTAFSPLHWFVFSRAHLCWLQTTHL